MIETSFSELVLWRRELAGAEMPATIPPSSSRPNPCLADGLLVSSILQGFAVAHDPATGEQVWRRELGRFGAASVYAAGGNLYARSDTTLYALAPETGEVRWRFTPIRDRPETVYSSVCFRQACVRPKVLTTATLAEASTAALDQHQGAATPRTRSARGPAFTALAYAVTSGSAAEERRDCGGWSQPGRPSPDPLGATGGHRHRIDADSLEAEGGATTGRQVRAVSVSAAATAVW